jgi:hypothetical protein
MNFKIILIILIAIVFLNIVVYCSSIKEGYEDGSVSTDDYNVNKLGEFRDNRNRYLTKYYGRPAKYKTAIKTCAEKAYNDGYSYFSLQHPQHKGKPQCFASNDYDRIMSADKKDNYVKHYFDIIRRWRKGRIRKTKIKKNLNSSDYGTGWGNTVYEIKELYEYDENEALDNIKTIDGVRNYTGTWEIIFGKTENGTLIDSDDWVEFINKNRITNNTTTTKDNNGDLHYGIIWRKCDNCTARMKNIFYKRIKDWGNLTNIEIKKLFLNSWNNNYKNKLNEDYELYSTYEDALNGTNKWAFCPTGESDIGFPATCGPSTSIQRQYRTYDSTSSTNMIDWTFLIEVVDAPAFSSINTV